MSKAKAHILREYGPFPGVGQVHGLTYDGKHVWFASGNRLNAIEPKDGKAFDFVSRTTPTAGKDENFLNQVLGGITGGKGGSGGGPFGSS